MEMCSVTHVNLQLWYIVKYRPQKIQEEKTWCKNLMLLHKKSSSVYIKNFFRLCMFSFALKVLCHLEITPAEMNPLLFILFFCSIQDI